MKGFKIQTTDKQEIHFRYYSKEAPESCRAFEGILPFTRMFFHARVSGNEIWIDDVPEVNVIQENSSVFTLPGEVVLGPHNAKRTKTAGCLGIYYGEGRGLDTCNIFACVEESDRQKLHELGNSIWKNGARELTFSSL